MSDNAENVHRLVELARIPVSVLPIASIDPDPEQPRRVERDVSGLAANMERAGQLQPVAVVSTEDGRYRLVFGEGRWLAAQSLAWTELVAHILDGLSAAEIAAIQLAENEQRDALSEAEVANGIQRVLDLGGSIDLAASAVTVAPEVIARASAVRQQVGETVPVSLSLLQWAALEEFSDEPEVVAMLTEAAESGSFDYRIAALRQERMTAERTEAALAVLEEAGVEVVERYSGGTDLCMLSIEPDAHSDCPGHAAWIGWDGAPVYVCTQPHLHGWGQSPEEEEERLARQVADKEQEATLREHHACSTGLRVEWLTGFVVSGNFNAKLYGPMYQYVWDNGLATGGGFENKEYQDTLFKRATSREKKFVALVIAKGEQQLGYSLRAHVWSSATLLQQALGYFDLLRLFGYKLNEGDEAMQDWFRARLAVVQEDAA